MLEISIGAAMFFSILYLALVGWIFALLGQRDDLRETSAWWRQRAEYWFERRQKDGK